MKHYASLESVHAMFSKNVIAEMEDRLFFKSLFQPYGGLFQPYGEHTIAELRRRETEAELAYQQAKLARLKAELDKTDKVG